MVDSMPGLAHELPNLTPGRRPGFLHNVLARFAALAAWKFTVAVVALVLAGGLFHAATEKPEPQITPGQIQTKAELHTAQEEYAIDFTYVVRKTHWYGRGDTITVRGYGSDEAFIDLSKISSADISRPIPSVVVLTLPYPSLKPAEVDLKRTKVQDKRRPLTYLAELGSSHPQDSVAALAAAQDAVTAKAAADQKLIAAAEAGARTSIENLLKNAGFKHVLIVFTPVL